MAQMNLSTEKKPMDMDLENRLVVAKGGRGGGGGVGWTGNLGLDANCCIWSG